MFLFFQLKKNPHHFHSTFHSHPQNTHKYPSIFLISNSNSRNIRRALERTWHWSRSVPSGPSLANEPSTSVAVKWSVRGCARTRFGTI